MASRPPPLSQLFSSSSNNDSTTTKTIHRILCYGDSLTAGTSSSMFELFPYAPHLERALANTTPNKDVDFVVRHRGMPGWLASTMEQAADDATYGLRAAVKAIVNPSLSCVIILAGTNDLGYAAALGDNPQEAVLAPIKALHEMAWAAGVPKTIAVAIPPSGYQARDANANFLVMAINQKLQEFCDKQSEGRALFCEFPFEYEQGGENWAPDGLHFSPKGYQVLGEYLKDPILQHVLDNNKKE